MPGESYPGLLILGEIPETAGTGGEIPPTAYVPPTVVKGITAAPVIEAPFRLDANGVLVTVPAGSQQDIDTQIYDVLSCPQGAKLGDPDFGIPSPLGQSLPLNLTPIVKAIQTIVPAAVDVSVVEAAIVATRPQSTAVGITAKVVTSA